MTEERPSWQLEALPQRTPRKRRRQDVGPVRDDGEGEPERSSGGADGEEDGGERELEERGEGVRGDGLDLPDDAEHAGRGGDAGVTTSGGGAQGPRGGGASARVGSASEEGSPTWAEEARREEGEEGSTRNVDSRPTFVPAVAGRSFEYLDHTADIQIHSWGLTLAEAMAEAALGMTNYMTPLEGIRVGPRASPPGAGALGAAEETTGEPSPLPPPSSRTFSASGDDLSSLLFSFLDEVLFAFNTDLFVCGELEITSLDVTPGAMRAEAVGRGEVFDRERHVQGTEVKAITYSAMQITDSGERGQAEIYVIVDI